MPKIQRKKEKYKINIYMRIIFVKVCKNKLPLSFLFQLLWDIFNQLIEVFIALFGKEVLPERLSLLEHHIHEVKIKKERRTKKGRKEQRSISWYGFIFKI